MMIASTCAVMGACGFISNPSSGDSSSGGGGVNSSVEPGIETLTVTLDKTNGSLSFTEVDGAVSYEILVTEYQKNPISYTATASPYVFSTLGTGEYRITVRALDNAKKELGVGSLVVTITNNIGMPQAPQGVSVSGTVLSWNAETASAKYEVQAVKSDKVAATKTDITDCSLDLSTLNLSAGVYEIRVYGVSAADVKGTAGTVRYIVKGNSAFGTEKSEGEYYIADFTREDDRAFAENSGATIMTDDSKVGIAYKDAEWSSKGVWYTLPEAINWDEVYQLKVCTRTTPPVDANHSGPYFYLYNEKNLAQGIYPEQSWAGFGTEEVGTMDEDGWVVTTFSAENIRHQNMNDSSWLNNDIEYLAHIFFGTAGVLPEVEVKYITYTKRTQAEGLDITYNGEALASEYRSVDKFDWEQLGVVGNYDVEYRLEKNGLKVDFTKEQRLEAGEYTLIARAYGKYYGKVEKTFTVKESTLSVPDGVTNLAYQDGKLTWSAVENASKYRITAKTLDGKLLADVHAETSTTEYTVALPAGKINVIVVSVSADGVESRDVVTQVVSVGDTNYLKSAGNENDELIIADFNSDDYNGFLTKTNASVADGYLVLNGKGASVSYDLPYAIDANEIYSINYRVSKLPEEYSAAAYAVYPTITLVNAEGEDAHIYSLSSDYYAISKTADGDYWNCEVRLDKLASCDGAQWAYYWSTTNTKLVKINIGFGLACENKIDYIHIVKKIALTQEEMTIQRNGVAISETDVTTATDFDWDKVTIACGKAAEFVLSKDGVEIEKTTYLEAGTYTLKATVATGRYTGSSEVTFTVRAVTVPDKVTELVWNKDDNALTWKEPMNTTSYKITVKNASGDDVTSKATFGDVAKNGDECSLVFTNLPVGYLTLCVQAVGEDNYPSLIESVTVGVLGENVKFNTKPSENSIYTTVMKPDHADYTEFVYAPKATSVAYEEKKGIVVTDEADEYIETEIFLPKPIQLNDTNYVLEFSIEGGMADVANDTMIWLYNDKGEYAYSRAKRADVWWTRQPYVEGGALDVWGTGAGVVVRITGEKILASTDEECQWTNKTASSIDRIVIKHKSDGILRITEVKCYDKAALNKADGIQVTSGSTDSSGNTKILDFVDEGSVNYDEFGVKNGVFHCVDSFGTLTLGETVSLTNGMSLELRVKGQGYVTLSDSNGNSVLSGGSYNKGQIASLDWGNDGGVPFTTSKDGDWTILTIAAENVTGSDVKSINIRAYNGTFYIDSIIAKAAPTQEDLGNELTIKYNGESLDAKTFNTTTEFDWSQLSIDGHTATYVLKKDGTVVEQTINLEAGTYTIEATVNETTAKGTGTATFTVEQATAPDEVTNLTYNAEDKKLSWTKSNGADAYVIEVKDVNGKTVSFTHGDVETEGDTCYVVFNELGAGYLTIGVKAKNSAADLISTAVTIKATVLGENVKFNNKATENSAYTTVMKPDHADYAGFVYAPNATSMEYVENGIKISGAANTWVSDTEILLPTPLNVKNMNFMLDITFLCADNITEATITLYNEKNESVASWMQKNNNWSAPAPQMNNGIVAVSGFGSGKTITISAAALAALDTPWTAESITKIVVSHCDRGEGSITITEIKCYDAAVSDKVSGVKTICGGTDGSGNTTILDFVDEDSVNYDEFGVKDGTFHFTTTGGWEEFGTFVLDNAVVLSSGMSIEVKFKGHVYLKLLDSNGNAVLSGGSNNVGMIAYYGWNDGGVDFTTSKDGDWTILTVAAENIVGSDVKSVKVQGGKAGTTYIDSIVAVPAA